MFDIKNENISSNEYHKLDTGINFSFSKENSNNNLENNIRQFGKNVKNRFSMINEKYLLCNPNKKKHLIKFFLPTNQNFPTKPKIKIETQINNENSENFGEIKNESSQLFDLKNLLPSSENKNEMKKIFNINGNTIIPFEIDYFFTNPTFNYDFLHQNDNNTNYEYINENFIDILLSLEKNKMILNENIKPLNNIQNDITFSKRNILLSWLTEVNFKYVKSQNILFITMKLIDRLLYKKNLNLDEFQLIGILCMNLALKMENHYKVFYNDEIIRLIGFKEESLNNNININLNLSKKILNVENKICDELNFDFETSSAVLILDRFIQILNIQNKKHFSLFQSISYFFLEISLYNEYFYELSDFTKALSSLLLTKEILKKKNIKTGFHSYFVSCVNIKKDEIKKYFDLCKATINELKTYKYGNTIFIKYQNEEFNKVINEYLNDFIEECKK